MSRKMVAKSFWTLTVRDPDGSMHFVHWKDHGVSGCYVDVCNPLDAEAFGSYRELRQAMKHDRDLDDFMAEWRKNRITPAKITVRMEVALYGEKRRKPQKRRGGGKGGGVRQ